MASGGDCPHAVVTARVERDETGGQGAIPEETPLVDPGTDCEDELAGDC